MPGADSERWQRGGRPAHRGRGGNKYNNRGGKRKDLGRQAYFRKNVDRRERNENEQNKRRKLDEDDSHTPAEDFSADFSDLFTKPEVESETRRPKHKVAVFIGYSGTGYKGMQIMPGQPTIERELFRAFILAGAISKANANDPKKSSFVRCARTDKGVHAAGNVISLKLVTEDEDILQKINSHLPAQIRVWGIERTVGSFSCYQACDSRWYEYLIPTSSFLPPHPSTYLAKQLAKLAEEVGDLDGYMERQAEVSDWWEKAEEAYIKPVLDSLDDDVRESVVKAMYHLDSLSLKARAEWDDSDTETVDEDAADVPEEPEKLEKAVLDETAQEAADGTSSGVETAVMEEDASHGAQAEVQVVEEPMSIAKETIDMTADPTLRPRLDAATKKLKTAYQQANSTYRLSPERLARVRDVLAMYEGSHNFHNFTIRKSPNDPSAKRHIKSFAPFRTPSSTTETGTFIINGTEWLSVKVHGQSFMMHQIRKMIGMTALVVRCGCPPDRIRETLSAHVSVSVPKAPALGLLLERPVFESYNTHRAAKFERAALTFDPYEKEMGEFKEREIYQKIYADEEKDHVFHTFFAQIDNYKNPAFLYLSSKGVKANPVVREVSKKPVEKSVRTANGSFRGKRTWSDASASGRTAGERTQHSLSPPAEKILNLVVDQALVDTKDVPERPEAA